MGSPSNGNPIQLLPTYISGFKNKTLDHIPKFIENRNISSLGLCENKKRKSPLRLPPSRVNASSLLLDSPVIPREILFQRELEHELEYGRHKLDPNIDMKRLKRIISNRLSAQRSRVKRVQYTLELEKKAEEYRDIIWILTPQVERQKEKQKLLLMEHESLQKEVERMANEENLREMEKEALKFEIQRLKELETGNMLEPEPDLNLDLTLQPYPTLSFYQESMQNLQNDSSLKKILASDSTLEQSVEEDVDQYFNFDEVNLDGIIFV